MFGTPEIVCVRPEEGKSHMRIGVDLIDEDEDVEPDLRKRKSLVCSPFIYDPTTATCERACKDSLSPSGRG